jgi:Helix-turn-helix domain
VRGEELRNRRLQRELELADAAAELGVPAKSVRALEWDRPDLIGDEDEAERIGRRYAALLGLEKVEPAPAPVPAAPPPHATERKPALWLPMLAALAPVAVIVVVYAVGKTGNGESAPQVDRGASSIVTNPEPSVAVEPPSEKVSPAPPAPARSTVNLVIAAKESGSWVEAHSDSETGPVLFAGTVDTRREVRLSARKIWLRLGAANNLSLTLNGRPAPTELFGTVDVVVTSRGIQPA